jgi:dipeptidyl-peptidase-4
MASGATAGKSILGDLPGGIFEARLLGGDRSQRKAHRMASSRSLLTGLRTLWFAAAVFATISPAAAQRRPDGGTGVYKTRIRPNWFDGGTRFWYRNDLSGGRREFVLVDAERGIRGPAFDHQRLADALVAAGLDDAKADRLPMDALEFKLNERLLEFRAGNRVWNCDLAAYTLAELEDQRPAPESPPAATVPLSEARRSRTTGAETELTFVNRMPYEAEIFWLDQGGQRRSYGKLEPGGSKRQQTYAGHVWEVVAADGRTLGAFVAEEAATAAILEVNPNTESPPARTPGRREQSPSRSSGRSPDGHWFAQVKDHNVFIRSTHDDREIQLSQDGREWASYGMVQWSPDSTALVAFRIKPAERKEVFLIESSPRGGGRAVLHSRPYALPGDDLTTYELRLFSIENQAAIGCPLDPIDFGTPRAWKKPTSTS